MVFRLPVAAVILAYKSLILTSHEKKTALPVSLYHLRCG